MDQLFDPPEEERGPGAAGGGIPEPPVDGPLAARMRPRSLEEYVGQGHLLGEGSALRTSLEAGHPHSMVLYGPPGTGKTTLARLAADRADAAFEELSAVQAGRAEVREVIARARERRRARNRGTIFFLDEIHRFNKAQQDALLPAVEEGLVTLIGATTENPYFEVNSALLSRTQVYELLALSAEDVQALLRRALERDELPRVEVGDEVLEFLAARSGGDARAALNALELAATTENPYFEVNNALLSRTQVYELQALEAADVEALLRRALARELADGVEVGDEVFAFLAARSGGDARAALNALELAVETVRRDDRSVVELPDAEDAMQRKAVLYDKGGDQHYDYISAWIKSTRGSDPDASLYYLAAMLEGGEDPRFIARRMIILASEDVGNADPHALPLAVAASQAVEHVGLPECVHALSQAAVYLSLAPKSNAAYRAIGAARAHIREHGAAAPPAALRSASYPGAAKLGRGAGYDYPHDEPGHVNAQRHLPDGLEDLRFYTPDDAEGDLRERLERARLARERD